MNERQVQDAFDARSRQTRLQVIRKLVIAGPIGLAAGYSERKEEVTKLEQRLDLKSI